MNNPCSAPRDDLQALFVSSRRSFAEVKLNEALERYPREEVIRQITAQAGPVVDEINRATELFARRTENVEFVTALGLSDFYFGPDTPTTISFEMRREYTGSPITTYEELIDNIESATHIDCVVTDGNQLLSFQIKRYPQAYLEHTNDAFMRWLTQDVLPHYPNMAGMTLVILLQPNTPPEQSAFNFQELSASLTHIGDDITFDGIALSYTDFGNGRQLAVLHKLYPEHRRTVAPLDWMLQRFRGEV